MKSQIRMSFLANTLLRTETHKKTILIKKYAKHANFKRNCLCCAIFLLLMKLVFSSTNYFSDFLTSIILLFLVNNRMSHQRLAALVMQV